MQNNSSLQEGFIVEGRHRLRQAKLKLTSQRIQLAALLVSMEDCHFAAETLHEKAAAAGVHVSLGTIYNSLHSFADAGMIRPVRRVDGRTVFDTNCDHHHHYLLLDTGELQDIESDGPIVSTTPPEGYEIADYKVTIQLRKK